ncbi:MAG TPA: acetyl-CoA carboxylase carboxyl transferase subunit alpha, partial [bacterium]|nr:acetyl-CoA carboxylase carboxyl transferase subunit alpha [bacterium]
MPEEKAGIPDFEKPLLKLEAEIEELERLGSEEEIDFGAEIKKLKQKHENLQKDIFSTLTPWQKVQLARHPGRPYTLDYINLIFQNFVELHGDRRFGDDPAIVAGFAQLNGEQVMLIGHQKGRDIQE